MKNLPWGFRLPLSIMGNFLVLVLFFTAVPTLLNIESSIVVVIGACFAIAIMAGFLYSLKQTYTIIMEKIK